MVRLQLCPLPSDVFLLPSSPQYVEYMEKKFLWCAYWVGLGILSSVGLGTGLHTFLLYLVRKDDYLVPKFMPTFTNNMRMIITS